MTTEFYKQLISERNIYILIAAIAVKCVVTAVYCIPNTGGAEAQYIKYIGEVSGEVTSEKLRLIDEEREYINKSLSEYPAAEDDYKNGRITEEEFRRYQNRYNYAVYCRGAFDRLEERKNYLVSMSERYPTVGFIYEAGVEKYLSGPVDIAVVIAVAILGSSVFSCEHKHRFTPTLRIYRRGRRELFFAKLVYVLSLAAGLFAVFSLITAFFIRFYYGVDYLGAHIMSIPRFASTGLDMSIGEYLVLHGAVSFLGHILFFLLTASLSELAQDQIKAIVIIVIIAAVPYYISVSGISGLGLFDYVNMMTPGDIRQGAISYLSCFAASVVLTACASAKWCRERSLRKKK